MTVLLHLMEFVNHNKTISCLALISLHKREEHKEGLNYPCTV